MSTLVPPIKALSLTKVRHLKLSCNLEGNLEEIVVLLAD
jgi:hypothetical protein